MICYAIKNKEEEQKKHEEFYKYKGLDSALHLRSQLQFPASVLAQLSLQLE